MDPDQYFDGLTLKEAKALQREDNECGGHTDRMVGKVASGVTDCGQAAGSVDSAMNTRGWDWRRQQSHNTHNRLVTTEWEDKMVEHGIIEDPNAAEKMEESLRADVCEALESYDPLAARTLEELDTLEDVQGDDDDEDEMRAYRERRIAELKAHALRNKYGAVVELRESQYQAEVTDCAHANSDVWVVCHMYQRGHTGCELVTAALEKLAPRFPAIKFCQILSTEAVEDYPDSMLPTVLVYHRDEIVKQFTRLAEWGGLRCTEKHVEWVLSTYGVLKSEMEGPPPEASVGLLSPSRGGGGGTVRGTGWGSDEDADDLSD